MHIPRNDREKFILQQNVMEKLILRSMSVLLQKHFGYELGLKLRKKSKSNHWLIKFFLSLLNSDNETRLVPMTYIFRMTSGRRKLQKYSSFVTRPSQHWSRLRCPSCPSGCSSKERLFLIRSHSKRKKRSPTSSCHR